MTWRQRNLGYRCVYIYIFNTVTIFLLMSIWRCMFVYMFPVHVSESNQSWLSSCLFQEIVDKDGQSKVLSFTIPSLSKPSVYHEVSQSNILILICSCSRSDRLSAPPPAVFLWFSGLDGRSLSQSRLESSGLQRPPPAARDIHGTEQVRAASNIHIALHAFI